MDQEWTQRIGETAGRIWKELDETGEASFTALKKTTREPEAVVHEALGWLAREGKITTYVDGRNRIFSLNGK